MRAAEGEDCECEGVVDGYVASHACEWSRAVRVVSIETLHGNVRVEACDGGNYDILLKLIDSGHVVGFDKRAVVTLACELGAASSDIVIALAVRSSSKLFEELQVRKRGQMYSKQHLLKIAFR